MALIKQESNKLIQNETTKNNVWMNILVEIDGENVPLQVGVGINSIKPLKINPQYDDEDKIREKQLANKIIQAILNKSEELTEGETYLSKLNCKVELYKVLPNVETEELDTDISF